MWLSKTLVGIFQVAKESVDALREELASIKTERDMLKSELVFVKSNFEWLRLKVNQLEIQNVALLKKAYDIDIPAPEIIPQSIDRTLDFKNLGFEDMGDELASRFGLPIYGDKQ